MKQDKYMYILFGAGLQEAFDEGGIEAIIQGEESSQLGYECYQHDLTDTSVENAVNLLSMTEGNFEYLIVTEKEFDKLLQ